MMTTNPGCHRLPRRRAPREPAQAAKPFARALCAVLCTISIQSWAADPLDPRAPVPPLRHESALSQYRPLAPQDAQDWVRANDEAGRFGGWRSYLRELAPGARPPAAASPQARQAQPQATSAPSTTTPPPTPTPQRPAHHDKH